MDKKYIRFIDSGYKTLFHVPDGGSIKVHSAWDGKDQIFSCKYIDSYHVSINGNCYHICQFAELMERNGNTYEPVQEIGDLDFYEKKFYDRDNVGSDGKVEPYYDLLTFKQDDFEYKLSYCLNPAGKDKTFCFLKLHSYDNDRNVKIFTSDLNSLPLDEKLITRLQNIVRAIDDEQRSDIPSLDSTIKTCQAKSSMPIRVDKNIDNQIDR